MKKPIPEDEEARAIAPTVSPKDVMVRLMSAPRAQNVPCEEHHNILKSAHGSHFYGGCYQKCPKPNSAVRANFIPSSLQVLLKTLGETETVPAPEAKFPQGCV